MATNTNNGVGGSQNHLWSSSSLQDGSPSPSPSPYPYYYTPLWGQRVDDDGNSVPLPVLFAVFVSVILLLRFFCTRGVQTDTEEQQQAGGGDDDDGTTVRQLQSNEAAGGGWAVEMAPPLVCAYRKADGLGEDCCGVCLADLDDGEAVRVLPACMHYFHASCVGEWLRGHDTCPLCRAQLILPGGAT